MPADTLYMRTRKGGAAMADRTLPMSAGFRRLLGLINGRRNGPTLLAELRHLDAEDLDMWTGELLRQGYIAPKDSLPAEDAAFSMTMEMPANYCDSDAVDAGALIASITGTASRPASPSPAPLQESRTTTGPGASALGAGFFICPDASAGLSAAPRACIASHEAAQSRLLALLVRRAGAVPDPVATREALLASLRAEPRPDVLFLDTDLPGIDGFHALESIRAKPTLQSLRIVLVAATGGRADLARALQLGATGYIAKPLTRDIMEAALPQIFGKRKTA